MMYQNVLPPQQILEANGKQSIDTLRMSPNSSCLIADRTAPIVWKCVSDGLGNVTAEPYDISPHKTEEQKQQDSLMAFMAQIDERLKKLEEDYESIVKRKPDDAEFISNKTGLGNAKKRKQSTSDDGTDDAE